MLWLLSANARDKIDQLATANADSMQWSLAQFEVEYLVLRTTTEAAQNGTQTLDEVRRRFDVFYSRVGTVKSSAAFQTILATEDVSQAMERVDAFLSEVAPLIDGDDPALRAALPGISSDLVSLHTELRTIALVGVRVFAGRAEAQRLAVADALRDLAIIALALLTGLLTVFTILLALIRASQRQNDQILTAQQRLQAIISTSLDAILVTDENGLILDYNGAAEVIFGHSREDVVGTSVNLLLVADHAHGSPENPMARYRKDSERRMSGRDLMRLQARRRDGSLFPVELSVGTAAGPESDVLVFFIRDISFRLRSENELVIARDRAVAGEKAKAELLAVMSHEMRTPLNGILGTLQLLEETDLTPRQRRFVDAMNTSGQTLQSHVNNVLDISRLDAGMGVTTTAPFALLQLTRDVIETLRAEAELRGNRLEYRSFGSGLDAVKGDEDRLRQILINLLGNAIKFTEDGEISVEIERLADSDIVELRVADTGIGIDAGETARIFDDFVTLDPSFQRVAEGTGLGLGIVRRLVALLDGEIGVESEPGEGSLFWVRLPLAPTDEDFSAPDEPLQRPNRPLAGQCRSVLVVEDNEINRMVVREMLEQQGCHVTEAVDGAEGLAIAGENRFDLILMDISMPRLDGLGAGKAIREGDGPNRETPIVALTAHALPEDIERFLQLGMDHVLTKPLARSDLIAVLDATRGKAPETVTPSPGSRTELEALLGDDAARSLLERVRVEVRNGLDDIRRMNRDRSSGHTIAALAHRLAGSAALAGHERLREHLLALEAAAASGRDIDAHLVDAEAALTDLEREDEVAGSGITLQSGFTAGR
ncbi:response regulator [Alphaproteobacteria bacterium GH1-50]|uniref:histidine kinase n=1 Tax=Kangsaoukella pontilimi TaxID=2691042 RepID=A0A7C9IFS9_9RHOB|nr:ATP-binding protein [Kangsaoukella pontilimi]MXQ07487.1 response regulator [Kangsaoukella pontilimi]